MQTHAAAFRAGTLPGSRRNNTQAARLPRSRLILVPRATTKAPEYVAPSRVTGSNELQALERVSVVVPDTMLMKEIQKVEDPKAATVSSGVLNGLLRAPGSLVEFKQAVERAVLYDKCNLEIANISKKACQMDKALANVGALLAERVEGRVSTEVDPRCAFDEDAIVARGKHLIALYNELGVAKDKVIIRIPATWEGIQAAGKLEVEGIATHLILVYSFVQGVAAAQAGASVVQPNVGRIADWYQRHPNAIRDPRGPREDSGYKSDTNPGATLTQQLYNLSKKHYPKTLVMAAGLRNKQDALALAGCDYLVLSPPVLEQLSASPTREGYNDGLKSPTADEEPGVTPALTLEGAQAAEFPESDLAPVTLQRFEEGLGLAGAELLAQGLEFLKQDAYALDEVFEGRLAFGSE